MSFLSALKGADECADVELAFLSAMCEVINTPHSLAIFIATNNHEYEMMRDMKPDPFAYCDKPVIPGYKGPQTFRDDWLVSNMLAKSEFIGTGIDTDESAYSEFQQIEDILEHRVYIPAGPPCVVPVRSMMTELLRSSDKDFLSAERLQEILCKGKLGPGSTTDVSGAFIQSDKLRVNTSLSPALLPFLSAIKGTNWEGDQPLFRVDREVEIIAVPKNSFTGRTICKNPTLNIIMQRGLGCILEDLLKINGVDIRDQKRSQVLASRAYELNLATIDMSAASSWFTWHNLSWIIPDDLLHFVDLVRPHYWKISGTNRVHYFNNWTPMGCGYTFPLMTLIFTAFVRSIVPKSAWSYCAIYGDDIILPRRYAQRLIDDLTSFGCKINSKKSFLDGCFFESCGSDWFAGHDVLPFYCRKGDASACAVPYRVQLANKLRLWSLKDSRPRKRFKPIWDSLIKKVPGDLRPFVPPSLGDVGLITSLEETSYTPCQEYIEAGWDQKWYPVKILIPNPVLRYCEDPFPYLMSLMGHTVSDIQDIDDSRLLSAGIQSSYIRHVVNFNFPEPIPPSFYRGEPVRGRFGKPITKRVISTWPIGLTWE